MFAQIVSRGYILLKPVALGYVVEEILICLQIAITRGYLNYSLN